MNIYTYRYAIKNTVLSLDQQYEVQDGSIVYLFIYHDYTNRRMPIIKATIEMHSDMISLLYKYKDIAEIKFDLYEYQYANDEVVNTKLYWQHTFRIVPTKDQTNYVTSQDTTTAENMDEMRTFQLFEMYLIDMTAVKWFTKEISTIFKDVSKPGALQALMQMRDIPSGITIATPPQDNEKIKYMIIPLGDLISNINTVNAAYGLYNSYPIIYYDLQNLYCINRMSPNIILPSATDFGDIVMILKNGVTPDHQICGSCNDLVNKTHYINLNQIPSINDHTTEISSTRFATIASVDSSGNVAKQTLDENATALSYVYAYNSMTMDQAINENMSGPQVAVVVNNCAVSFLKPYKLVSFEADTQYEDLKLNGNSYRIMDWSISITRETVGSDPRYTHEVTIDLIQPTLTKK